MAKTIRNIVLLSHSGAGKTSLSEALLFQSGTTKKPGSVVEGTTLSDYSSDEIERKISINSSLLHCVWDGCQVHLIDTPGYADFLSETIGSLYAIDGAVIVVDATTGVQVGTERAWELLESRKVPRLFFINKLDKENAAFEKTFAAIQEQFGKGAVPIQIPDGQGAAFKGSVSLLESGIPDEAKGIREKLFEGVAEQEDALLEKYFDKGSLEPEDLANGLRRGALSGTLFPILCGSSLKGDSAKALLQAVVTYLPSPSERGSIQGKDPVSGEAVERKPDPKEPFAAQVFKTISDPYLGQLTVFRVFSGTLLPEGTLYNTTRRTKERIGKLFLLQGKSQTALSGEAGPGEIVGVAKLKETQTGDSLADEKHPILLDPISFPEPAISVSLKPKNRTDEDKISDALAKLSAEDRAFKVIRDAQTKELIVSGMGDLHLTVMVGRLKSRFGVEVEVGTPKVAYKETITKGVRVQGKYKKQSGGHGQYGDCWIQVEPLPRGGDFEFVDKVVGGAIPRNYIPSVEKGVRQAMSEGVLAGYPLVDIKVTVDDGSFHPVDSSDLAFQVAGGMALRKAILEAHPVLLEPIMDVEISIPGEHMGSVTGDLNSRRGRVLGMDLKGKAEILHAKVPLAEMLKYAPDLKSLTGGRGFYTMKFSHYEIVPQRLSQEVIQHAKAPVLKEA